MAFAVSAQARGCVVTTILPCFFAAIPIAAGVIWLVMRSMLRDEQGFTSTDRTST